jgi:hypothetical protein
MTEIYKRNLLHQGTKVVLKDLGDHSLIATIVTPVAWWGMSEEDETYRIIYGRDNKVMLVQRKDLVVCQTTK